MKTDSESVFFSSGETRQVISDVAIYPMLVQWHLNYYNNIHISGLGSFAVIHHPAKNTFAFLIALDDMCQEDGETHIWECLAHYDI